MVFKADSVREARKDVRPKLSAERNPLLRSNNTESQAGPSSTAFSGKVALGSRTASLETIRPSRDTVPSGTVSLPSGNEVQLHSSVFAALAENVSATHGLGKDAMSLLKTPEGPPTASAPALGMPAGRTVAKGSHVARVTGGVHF